MLSIARASKFVIGCSALLEPKEATMGNSSMRGAIDPCLVPGAVERSDCAGTEY
jgi:hypothetical protein